MATAYDYIRFSMPCQKLNDSLRRQLERPMAYALEHGLTPDQSMRDEGLLGETLMKLNPAELMSKLIQFCEGSNHG